MKLLLLTAGIITLTLCAEDQPPPPVAPKPKSADAGEAPKKQTNELKAVLLGKEITAKTPDHLKGTIVGALFERYAAEAKVEVTQADLDAQASAMEQMRKESTNERKRDIATLEKELKDQSLAEATRKEKEETLAMYRKFVEHDDERATMRKENPAEYKKMTNEVAQKFVQSWKLNQSLYKKYGGRVIFQQFGPEPLDAYRDFLKEREKAGDFKIEDKEASEKFWNYFVNEKMHTFLDDAEGRQAMETPWWLQKKPR